MSAIFSKSFRACLALDEELAGVDCAVRPRADEYWLADEAGEVLAELKRALGDGASSRLAVRKFALVALRLLVAAEAAAR